MEWSPPSTMGIWPALQRLHHQLGFLRAGFGDFGEVLGARIAFRPRLQHGDRHVAAVLHDVAERFELALQPGDADGRRPHVDAAARLSEIERNADDANLLGYVDVLQRFGGWTGCHMSS